MRHFRIQLFFLFFIVATYGFSQTNPVIGAFPKGTILHGNVRYSNDTIRKHLLDIYLPVNAKGKVPLVILIHGGGWLSNDKYADIGYMKKTVAEIVSNGYALASIDYRFSTQAVFPAQMQDCNRAVSFLYDNCDKYGFDKNDPPFLIIHGEKDQLVSTKQSQLLSAWLSVKGVQNELFILKDAPHFGEMFDSDEIRDKVMNFLRKQLN